MKKENEYYSSVAFYMDQRGLNHSSLGAASGIHRNTIRRICAGELIPGKDKQQKLAVALHIDADDLLFCSDPETVKKKVVDIKEITEVIVTSFSALPPHIQGKKADNVSAYLSMNDITLDAYIRYWLLDSNILGHSFPVLALRFTQTQSDFKKQPKVSAFPTALEAYRVQRKLSKSSLSKKSYIERHIVSRLCNGTQKPSQEQLRALAHALDVDDTDLEQDLALDSSACPLVVDMEQEKAKILHAIACCKPRRLKDSLEVVLAYLHDREKDTDDLFGCLLSSASPNKTDVLNVFEALMKQRWSYSDETLYTLGVEVGYCRSKWEDNSYEAYVLFDDPIYSLFHLESPKSKIHYPESEDSYGLPQNGMDFPIFFCTDLTPEDDRFESELLDQVEQFLISVTDDMPANLFNIFFAYLEDTLYRAHIIEWTNKDLDLDLTLPSRLRKREAQYDKIFFEMRANANNYIQFQKDLVKTFSRMREDPEYEHQILETYGLLET